MTVKNVVKKCLSVGNPKNINAITLDYTEKMFMKGLIIAEKYQKISNKAIKNGLNLSAKQQEIAFDNLEVLKGKLMKIIQKRKVSFSNK